MPFALQQRQLASIQRTVHAAREIVERQGAGREALGQVLEQLDALAREEGLWPLADFPCLDERARQTRYLMHEDPESGFTLYLIVWLPGRSIAPHNHTTWACIAPISGTEQNTLYERVDGRTGPGPARVEQRGVRLVSRSEGGLTLLPHDVHAVDIVGDEPSVNLHLYGRSLESLTERLSFNLDSNTAFVRGMGVPSVVWQPDGVA